MALLVLSSVFVINDLWLLLKILLKHADKEDRDGKEQGSLPEALNTFEAGAPLDKLTPDALAFR